MIRYLWPLLLLGAVACALLCAGARVLAEEEEPAPQPPVRDEVLISQVESDPPGEASRVAKKARAALAKESYEEAYARLVELAELHPEVLLETAVLGDARRLGLGRALRWPGWRLANLGLARLPRKFRDRVEERWRPLVGVLLRTAAREAAREPVALEALAQRYGVTQVGSDALLALAERELVENQPVRAAGRLRSWMSLNPKAERAQRAAVAVRLADTLTQLEDAGALDRLEIIEQDLREVPVQVAGRTTTLAERLSGWRIAQRKRVRRATSTSAAPPDGADLTLLWSRSLEDPGHLRQLGSWYPGSVQAGAWGQGNTLVLHEGRTIRRLDLLTGRERWRFPEGHKATIHDPAERYRSFDLPWRAVTPAGDSVLVVLGDPRAMGRYTFLDREYEADRLGRECRLRLASLDLATGALRWHTGNVNDTHPVLGHAATGCASPPLVVGDRIYCLFASYFGSTTFYLACLDRDTGAARWVSQLAAGSSGRLGDQSSIRSRFTSPYVQSSAWGARPTLAGDEVCVVPNAGFAAGVAAEHGAVRWLRGLPRYALDAQVPASKGHNVRNAPVAWGDAWYLAPMDGPRLLCLARGSGALRWQRGEASPDTPPAWRDLLGIRRDGRGHAHIRLSGWVPLEMSPADGALDLTPHLRDWELDPGGPGGAAFDLGPFVARAAEGMLQVQRWEPPPEEEGAWLRPLALPTPACPPAGDLLRIGDIWVVVGMDRVAAVAPAQVLDDVDLGSAGPALRGLLAVLHADPDRLLDALALASQMEPGPARTCTYETLEGQLRSLLAEVEGQAGEGEHLAQVRKALRLLPPALRGAGLRIVAGRLLARGQDRDAAGLLVAWLEGADDTLVETVQVRAVDDEFVTREEEQGEGTQVRQRGDLMAGALLRAHLGRPGVRAVFDARERLVGKTLAALRGGSEAALRAAMRRGAGTRALDLAREALAERLAGEQRHADAAALVADRRLDPPWVSVQDDDEARTLRAAQLQLIEAGLLGEAGEGDRARTLLADLTRWAPPGVKDARGRGRDELAAALRQRFGWYPYRNGPVAELDVWGEHPGPVSRDALRNVEFLGLEGPGAEAVAREYVLLVRGLTLEVWSLVDKRRVATLPGRDEGWFGGSLTSVERWIPGGGILVSSLVAGEPADASGVNDGDWVRTWGGQEVTGLPAFMQLVAASRPGVEIPASVWRMGREVLARFRTGRRPGGRGRLLEYGPLWVDAGGRVLLPGRTGLTHVDPRAGTRTPLWTWNEPGVVRRADVLAGTAYVTVQRGLQPHLLVAVDTGTGRERWRHAVQGRITHMRSVGSAIAIHTQAPEECTLLDRHDGRARAVYRCFDQHRWEFRGNWNHAHPADHACGRTFLVQGTDSRNTFLVVNTTRGGIEYEDAWDRAGRFSRFVNPQVVAGAYAAVVRAPGLALYFPDPLGGTPRHRVLLSGNDLSAQQGNLGAIDVDSRIYLRGDRLYVVRLPRNGRENVNAAIFHIDYEGLRRHDPTDEGGHGDIFFMSTQKVWLAGSPAVARYILNIRPYFEGIFVGAARLQGEHMVEHYWVVGGRQGEPGPEDHLNVRLLEGEVRDAQRHAPVRAGPWLYVPTDRGARMYPVKEMR